MLYRNVAFRLGLKSTAHLVAGFGCASSAVSYWKLRHEPDTWAGDKKVFMGWVPLAANCTLFALTK